MASFQSLSGFLARCNVKGAIDDYESFFAFQSLSGFLARCNSLVLYFTVMPSLAVSIPVGFSCSLQLPGFVFYGDAIPGGFNPCRVFLLVATLACFGICDSDMAPVSIPVGFSCSLQLY